MIMPGDDDWWRALAAICEGDPKVYPSSNLAALGYIEGMVVEQRREDRRQ